MSLKAKLEAVIYAAEEPVTLTQLASLFAADALEWKAQLAAAAAEQTAEVADAEPAPESLPLLAEAALAEEASRAIPETEEQPAQSAAPEAAEEAPTPEAADEAPSANHAEEEPGEAEASHSAGGQVAGFTPAEQPSEPNPDSDSEAAVEPEDSAETPAETAAESAEPESDPESESEPNAEEQTEEPAQAETEEAAEAATESADAESIEASAEADAESEPEAEPEAETEPEPQEEAEGDSEAEGQNEAEPEAESDSAETSETEAPASETAVDPELEARRLARLRDREIKGILKQILDELIEGYATDDRGIEIREIAGGYRMATKPECHDAVRLFVKSLKPPLKLSLPALETLAVVAYKQPITAPEVSEIRGVESGGVLGSLLSRKLVATAGRKQVIGRPILYKTTKEFLLRFGLKDLTELPSMEEFEKMAAIEIEEELHPEAAAAEAAARMADAAQDMQRSLLDNSPSGTEMAEEIGEAVREQTAASEENSAEPESPAAAADKQGQEPDAPHTDSIPSNAPEAAPAEPDSTLQAETEIDPHAEEESHQEGR